jgi:hypothetical protein
MRRTTGIELGPDSCVVVAARRGRSAVEVSAVHVLDLPTGSSHDGAVTEALQSARRDGRLPRRAVAVVWGLPDDASADDPEARAAVRAVAAAGFRVRQVLTPPQALTALAATRAATDPEAAVAWMALNTHGVALAIVRGGELLFSRTFDWAYRPGIEGSKEQLLQRYALVSYLAPELQRGIAAVRDDAGVAVERAVSCGNLPELRSLTMPLIEELDLEVETLDSIEGLRAVGRVEIEGFDESAAVIRLAVAAAVAPRLARPGTRLLRTAAAVAVVAGLGWLAYAAHLAQQDRAESEQTAPQTPGAADGPTAAGAPPPATGEPDPASSARAERNRRGSVPSRTAPSPPPAARETTPPRQPAATGTPTARVPQRRDPPPAAPQAAPQEPARPTAAPPQAQPERAVSPVKPAERPATPVPLADPVPRIQSILIDHNRRLAIIDGRVVAVGDRVGPRVVVLIEAEAIVLREPSGLDVRVPLRGGRQSSRL